MCDERLILLIRVITECTWRRMHNVISSLLLFLSPSPSLPDISSSFPHFLSFLRPTCINRQRAFSTIYLKSDLIRASRLPRRSARLFRRKEVPD
jgi:hypothetical protein